MSTHYATCLCLISGLLLGGASAASLSNEPQVGGPSPITLSSDTFVDLHVSDGLACSANQVMIGIHIGKGKVACASLNFGDRVAETYKDVGGSDTGTQVSDNPPMHGCAPNFFVQRVDRTGPGENEDLTCVALQTITGVALKPSSCVHDGRGANNDGTQSTIYGLSPKMHACPMNMAMNGIHQTKNDLNCCG
jgi:hypothetical protein